MSRVDEPQRRGVRPGQAALLASAFVLLALLIVRLDDRPSPAEAMAGNVTEIGDTVALTADIGNNEDALFVLDRRGERLVVYAVDQNRRLAHRGSFDLGDLFVQARRGGGGRR